MPSPKSGGSTSHRRGQEEKYRRGRLAGKSSSFHSWTSSEAISELRRPKTVPDLLPSRSVCVTMTSSEQVRPAKPTKVLLNVTIQGSVGAVQVLMSTESTVGNVVAAALSQFVKEGRRPILPTTEPSRFNLHYSQFSLECKYSLFVPLDCIRETNRSRLFSALFSWTLRLINRLSDFQFAGGLCLCVSFVQYFW